MKERKEKRKKGQFVHPNFLGLATPMHKLLYKIKILIWHHIQQLMEKNNNLAITWRFYAMTLTLDRLILNDCNQLSHDQGRPFYGANDARCVIEILGGRGKIAWNSV